jgi:bacterioferritin
MHLAEFPTPVIEVRDEKPFMKGNDKVISELNKALHDELTAIVQYMVQAEVYENWGYGRLAGLTKGRAMQEMHHAERLIERIIFLDGTPNVTVPLAPNVGSTVQEQLQADLDSESGAIRTYNEAVALCSEAGDAGTKDLFEALLGDEEKHADFLEAQLHSIKEMGIGVYLAQQMGR